MQAANVGHKKKLDNIFKAEKRHKILTIAWSLHGLEILGSHQHTNSQYIEEKLQYNSESELRADGVIEWGFLDSTAI